MLHLWLWVLAVLCAVSCRARCLRISKAWNATRQSAACRVASVTVETNRCVRAGTLVDGGSNGTEDAESDRNGSDALVVCGQGQTLCGGKCVILAEDELNCGGCGAECTAPMGGEPVCSSNRCAFVCSDPLKPCATTCHNLDSDADNCSACRARAVPRSPTAWPPARPENADSTALWATRRASEPASTRVATRATVARERRLPGRSVLRARGMRGCLSGWAHGLFGGVCRPRRLASALR